MTEPTRRRPLPSPDRESHARTLFPLDMTPEEYAARQAHRWLSFSFDEYEYPDPLLDSWVHRLGDILFQRNNAPSLDALRQRFLTSAEYEAVLREQKEEV